MAAIPAVCRLRRLLLSALVLPPLLPAVAMQAAVKGPERSPGVLLAQASAPAGQAIPAEVQGWADGATAAYEKGDTATSLRLQKQVVAWLQANRPTPDAFRALALLRLGVFLSAQGQRQEALAPTEEAVKLYRELAKTNPAVLPNLAASLNNLGIRYSDLGRRRLQEGRHGDSLTAAEAGGGMVAGQPPHPG
ncbi:MAG: tetratricopeptide repeat protein, partial [Cyanobium sp.]